MLASAFAPENGLQDFDECGALECREEEEWKGDAEKQQRVQAKKGGLSPGEPVGTMWP